MTVPEPDWAALAACPQDREFHAEGDVATHTRMVEEALRSLESFKALEEPDRELMVLAARWHDVGKLVTTREEEGRITSRGHSRRGAMMVRRRFYEAGVDPGTREWIAGLVRAHQLPFHALGEGGLLRVFRASLACRMSRLAMLARADNMGRESRGQHETAEAVELFEELCREQGCFEESRPFPSDHSRFLFFRLRGERDPDYLAHDDTQCEMVLMSGLPAAGKDTWVTAHCKGWPVVALDALRTEMDIDPEQTQGEVVQCARELVREHLRARRSFVLNATNLSATMRERWIGLAADYHARVRIVYVETPLATLLARNRARPAKTRVPERVILALLDRWDLPDRSEAHAVETHFGGEQVHRPHQGSRLPC